MTMAAIASSPSSAERTRRPHFSHAREPATVLAPAMYAVQTRDNCISQCHQMIETTRRKPRPQRSLREEVIQAWYH